MTHESSAYEVRYTLNCIEADVCTALLNLPQKWRVPFAKRLAADVLTLQRAVDYGAFLRAVEEDTAPAIDLFFGGDE